ncbi:mucin-2-like isoform X2 [Homarus americanus]|uniref:mucin-2-like isoform X2 n=1 Tax=Homarus americanus TaxID=6706 RepID=UPI001C468A9F|nr:mucin-2-like isoform X2 [Homarus americanus]
MFGTWRGLAVTLSTATAGVFLAHILIRVCLREVVHRRVVTSRLLRALLAVLGGPQAFKVVFVTRLTPIPFGLQNAVFAVSRVPTWLYLAATVVGLLPTQVLNCYLGTTVRNLDDVVSQSPSASATGWGVFAVQIVISIGLTMWVVRRAKAELHKTMAAQLSDDTQPTLCSPAHSTRTPTNSATHTPAHTPAHTPSRASSRTSNGHANFPVDIASSHLTKITAPLPSSPPPTPPPSPSAPPPPPTPPPPLPPHSAGTQPTTSSSLLTALRDATAIGTRLKSFRRFRWQLKHNQVVPVGRVMVTSPWTSPGTQLATSDTHQVSHNSQRATSDTHQVSHNSQRVTSNTHQVNPNSQRATSDTHQVSHNSQRVTSDTHQVNPNSQLATSDTHQVSHNSQRATSDTHQVSHNSQRVTSNTHQVNPNSQRATSDTHQVSHNSQRVTSDTHQVNLNPDTHYTIKLKNSMSAEEEVMHTLPHVAPTTHYTMSNIQHTTPTRQHTTPTRQHTTPTRQHTTPTRQHTTPTRQHTTPTIPHTTSTRQHTTPTIPHTMPTIQHTTPTIPHTMPTIQQTPSSIHPITEQAVLTINPKLFSYQDSEVTSSSNMVQSIATNTQYTSSQQTIPTHDITTETIADTSPQKNKTTQIKRHNSPSCVEINSFITPIAVDSGRVHNVISQEPSTHNTNTTSPLTTSIPTAILPTTVLKTSQRPFVPPTSSVITTIIEQPNTATPRPHTAPTTTTTTTTLPRVGTPPPTTTITTPTLPIMAAPPAVIPPITPTLPIAPS